MGLVGGNLETGLTDGHYQLYLVLKVISLRRIGNLVAVEHNGVGWFGKEERKLSARITPHFPSMSLIVAAYTEDATYREEFLITFDSNTGDGTRFEYVITHGFSLYFGNNESP